MKRFFDAVILVCLVVGLVWAVEPSFPNYSGFVNDFAGVIDSAAVEKLESLSRALEQKTSVELAIATVSTVAPLDPKTYAVKLFEKWKIGKKGKDNGILILLAMKERRVEIEVGYGLEGVINDAKAGEILDKYVVPFFKRGRFGEGLYNGVAAIAERIAESSDQALGEEYAVRSAAEEREWPRWTMLVIVGSIIALVILSAFFSGIASGLFGAIVGMIIGLSFAGLIGAILGAIIGFVLSYTKGPWAGGFGGGWGGGFGGGGFGGFGGGRSGGGGAGRSW